MVVSAGPLSSEKAEMNILEINEKLRPQLAEKKQQFRNLQEKCFVTQLAGFLAKGQKKYKYEECEDLIKSMLRNERRQFKEEKLAEQLKQAEALRQYKVLVHSQERELTQLKEKLREGRDASRSLHEHLQALLTPDEPDKSQGQDLQEQLAEGCRLAQQLVQKLSPENDNDDDEDVQVEVAEKVQKSSAPREMQKAEEKEVPEDSLEECAITCSNSHGPYDSNQPHRKTKITFEEDKVDSTLIGSSSHVEWEDAVHIIPENESDDEEEEEKGPVSPRGMDEAGNHHSQQTIARTKNQISHVLTHRNLQESEEEEVPQESWDEGYSTLSMPPEMLASYQSYSSTFHSLEEQQVCMAVDIGRHRWDQVKKEDQEATGPRLSRELLEVVEPEVLQDSLDRCYSTPSVYLGLTDSCQPYRSAFYVLEQQSVGLAVDMDEIEKYQEVEEDQDPSCPRLSRELLDEKGPEVLQDSLDRCYSTPSGYLELPDLGQPYSSAVYSLEEQYLGLALDVDRIKKDQEEEEDQGPPCPRLSRELLEVVEPEVLQDSVDRCYSTPSSCLEQPDSCQPYGSSFYALEEKHVGFSLDVGEIEKKGKGKKRRGRRSKKKRRRGRKEGEEDQNPPCPRLNGVLMEVEEPEVLQDSLDRCYSTPSMYFELPDSFQHYRSVFYSFEEQHISFALYVDNRFFTLTVTSLHVVFQMEVIFPQ
ncbi:neuroblastoma breakpoint family member 15 isoform X2 [Pan troglodytes]|uniref:neuroblastoma breakpoint family member 15 isoform X2 n=1 Tax=Pan troglodytes TaxID=9598 RepID=UPI003013CFB7